MAGKGSKPGERRGGRKKGVANKVTTDVRGAFATLLQGKVSQLNGWLTTVGKQDPGRALDIVIRLAEYHIPKLSRTELTGPAGGPMQIVHADEKDQQL